MTTSVPEMSGIDAMRAIHDETHAITLPETLGEFVAQQAATHGDRVLAEYIADGDSLTYRGLDQQANRFASALLARGVRKRTHVALMLPNIKEWLISWVALGRIGAVIVPVNTAYTASEVEFVLADSDAQFLIIDEEFLPILSGIKDLPQGLDTDRVIVRGQTFDGHASWSDLLESGSDTFTPPAPVHAVDLLNLQYTSGTTGFPKGCMLTHEYWMLIGQLAWSQRGGKVNAKRTLIWAPFFYMDPQWQLLSTMIGGGTVFVARRMSLSSFMDWLIDLKIENCIFPEAAMKRFPPGPRDKELSLRVVNAYGWRSAAYQDFEKRFGVPARNGFGMTEIGGGLSMPVAATDLSGSVACGLPVPYRGTRIVDSSGKDVAPGEIGELWVTGRAIMLGYYKRPQANADSFVGEWFRTGDLFRQDEQGYFHIVGRIKEMIKRSGENVSAHEVEAVLRKMEAVEDAAAIPVPDPDRGEEVKVLLMLAQGHSRDTCTPEQIIAHCTDHLAGFKIPRYISYVDEFPRTAARKIAKQKIINSDHRNDEYDMRST